MIAGGKLSGMIARGTMIMTKIIRGQKIAAISETYDFQKKHLVIKEET